MNDTVKPMPAAQIAAAFGRRPDGPQAYDLGRDAVGNTYCWQPDKGWVPIIALDSNGDAHATTRQTTPDQEAEAEPS